MFGRDECERDRQDAESYIIGHLPRLSLAQPTDFARFINFTLNSRR